jgi:agmatine/peptidylarginine deiminase
MPPINKYKCNFCDFSFPDGWGGYFYVEVDEELIRNRIHELEDRLSNLNRNFTKIEAFQDGLDLALAVYIR